MQPGGALHRGTRSLVRWQLQLLQGLDVEELLKCLTVPVFIAICRRILNDFSSFRSGFPDLLMWDPSSSTSTFVEVKGPRDVLSLPQAMWLDYLCENEASVMVATIQA